MTEKKGYRHEWVDGVCQKCGKPCDHEWECETGICIKCQEVCEHKKWAFEDTDADSPVYECWYCQRCGYVFGFINEKTK